MIVLSDAYGYFSNRSDSVLYGYCSAKNKNDLHKRVLKLTEAYPKAIIIQELLSDSVEVGYELSKLIERVTNRDTIVFVSVDNLSSKAKLAFENYDTLYNMRGIRMVFLNEPYFNSDVCDKVIKANPEFFKHGDLYILMMEVIREQINYRFEQLHDELKARQQRSLRAIAKAKEFGKQIGQKPGATLHVKKKAAAKDGIRKLSKSFGGDLNDIECMRRLGLSSNTYYKYKKELKNEPEDNE